MWRAIIFLLCVCFVASGCGSKDYEKGDRRDFAQKILQEIIRRNSLALSQELAEEVDTLDNRAALRSAFELLPREPLKGSKLVAETQKGGDTQFVYRLDYSDRAVFALVTVRDQPPRNYEDSFEVVGVYLAPRSAKDLDANSFELKNLRIGQYLIFPPFAVVPIFVALCFFACLFSSLPWKAKVVWLPCMLVGLFQINYVWATGFVQINLLAVQFPTVNVARVAPWANWVVQLSLPLAAIIFWRRYPNDVWQVLSFLGSLPVRNGKAQGLNAKLTDSRGDDGGTG